MSEKPNSESHLEESRLSPREALFGDLAVRHRYLSVENLDRALELRNERIEKGESPYKLPSLLREEGYLDESQYEVLKEEVLEREPRGKGILGPYKILGKIGQGGMGIVYLAVRVDESHETAERVAVKVLGGQYKHDARLRERFEREYEAIRNIRHENLVTGYHAGVEDGVHYFVMEYVDGPSAKQKVLKKGRFEVQEAIRIARLVAEGLVAVHEAGYVHRDVKSSNVLLGPDGVVKLSDLGLARDTESDSSLTRLGTGLGSLEYASPEQLKNASQIDGRSDIYSLGVTLFEMLTGRVPFIAVSLMNMVSRKLNDKPPDVTSFRSDLSPRLGELIAEMLDKNPSRRPQTLEEVLERLEGATEIPRRKGRRTRLPRSRRRSRRRRR